VATMRVLALGAHPDDIEINCAGTLRLLAGAGIEIHVATMTLGDCGSRELSAKDISAQRRIEAENACALLGARYHYAGSSDFSIFNDDGHNRRVTALFRSVAPNIVITHSPVDYLLDHESTSTLGRNACFCAPTPNYDTSAHSPAGPIDHVPHLYYFDPMEGMDIFGKPVVPEFYVDISGVMDFKRGMLAQHKSQRDWLRKHHGVDDYLNSMQAWSAARAAEVTHLGHEAAYAEAFRQHRGHAYPQDNVLQAVLKNLVVVNPSY